MMLADNLVAALESLNDESPANGSPLDRPELVGKLKAEEDEEYKHFFDQPVDDIQPWFVDEEATKYGLKGVHFFRNKAICHTALLPAQTRYLGIVTGSNNEAGLLGDYDKGMSAYAADGARTTGRMKLVYDPKARQACEVSVGVDYKDYFYVTSTDGWSSIMVPNDAERAAYGYEDNQLTGIIMMCFVACDWGRCLPGEVR